MGKDIVIRSMYRFMIACAELRFSSPLFQAPAFAIAAIAAVTLPPFYINASIVDLLLYCNEPGQRRVNFHYRSCILVPAGFAVAGRKRASEKCAFSTSQ